MRDTNFKIFPKVLALKTFLYPDLDLNQYQKLISCWWSQYFLLLCSWDKSLNIGSCMLRIFLKVHSFTFDHLNCMQPIVWDMNCSHEIMSCRKQFLGIYLVDRNTFQDNPFCSLIITDTKSDNPKHHKKNKGLFPKDRYIEGVASDLLHIVQTVKCEGVNFLIASQQANSIIQALIYTVGLAFLWL